MQVLCYDLVHSTQTRVDVIGSFIRVGRSAECDIILNNPLISDVTMILRKDGDIWEIQPCGINEIEVGGILISHEKTFLLEYSERIKIKPAFEIILDIPTKEEATRREKIDELNAELTAFANKVHLEILQRMRLEIQGIDNEKIDDDKLIAIEKDIEDIAKKHGVFIEKKQYLASFLAGQCVRDELLQNIEKTNESVGVGVLQKGRHFGRLLTASPASEEELIATAKTFESLLKITSDTTLEERIGIIEEKFWDTWEEIDARRRISTDFKNYWPSLSDCRTVFCMNVGK